MPQKKSAVIVRFPPSPTGFLHIGGARTALFNYLFAQKYGGQILLRLENTDRERSKKEYEDNILESLAWLGLKFDNKEPIRQSERGAVYQKYLEKLLASGAAYHSKEEAVDTKGGRAEVIRFKNPNKKISFNDLIRSKIEFDTTDLGDFVIAKSLTEPLYHLAVVVDDFEMGITHVIRGEDHISNTPRQILIAEAIGAKRPEYAHIPLILAPDKTKLSKRHGAVSVTEYRDKGYLKEAFVNYLALLGWNPGTNQELFSMEELIDKFDLSRVHKGGAIFDSEKLDWLNKEYLKKMPTKDLESRIFEELRSALDTQFSKKHDIPREMLTKLTTIVSDRIYTFGDIKNMVDRGELNYFFQEPVYDPRDLICKSEQNSIKTTLHLQKIIEFLKPLENDSFTKEAVKSAVWGYADKEGRGNVLWPMRLALSGLDKSPDPFTLAEILGKEETLKRLQNGYNLLVKLV